MIEAELPDGTVLEFPDETSPDVVQRAVKSHLGVVNKPQQKSMSWADVPGEALSNIPQSAGNFYGSVLNAVAHPIDAAKGLVDLGAGALRNITPKALSDLIDKANSPEQQKAAEEASQIATQVGGMYKDRYGGVENIKKTLATDPVGVAADLSTVLGMGAGLAKQGTKIPAVAAKSQALADALMAGSKYTNPLSVVAPVAKGAYNMADEASQRLMRSALKPTLQQIKSGAAQTAVETLLENGINPTKGGVEKMKGMIDSLDQQIADKIANSTGTVSKSDVLNALDETRQKFGRQVSPTSDLNAIQNISNDFVNHPSFPSPVQNIPVQAAQEMKQGTYGILSKKYGQIGSAETEAQKALARGLKEGVAKAVPEVAGLNAKESRLIQTLDVAERRALMDMNKNPMGLSLLANNPVTWAAFMADKSALFKSLAARMLHQTAKAGKAIPQTTPQAKLAAALAARTNPNE